MKFLLLFLAFAAFIKIECFAQTSRIVPWQDVPVRRAYEPMPVLCVHGIGSDSVETWPIGVNILSNYFSTTYYWQGASQVSRQRANQPGAAYVETFDYGVYNDPTIVTTHGHEQTFDTIRSNAWDGVYQSSLNGCITLKKRISDLRDAYILADNSRPNITLLAHSMGGIVSHYYLCRAEESGVDSGVARLITLGTPHYGSTIPNWQRQVNSAAGGRAALMRPLQQHSMEYFLQYCAGFYERDAWNFVHYANPPVNQPEKGGMTDMSYHVPYAGNIVPFLRNPLIPYFQTHPVAGDVEYVVNSFTVPILSIQMLKNLGISMVRLLDSNIPFLEAFGDGIVPTFSQEGRALPGSDPDIYMGMNLLQGAVIRPVIYSGWKHIHMGEATVTEALKASLDGVPYRWPDPDLLLIDNPNQLPPYAGDYDEMNSFAKYLPPCDPPDTGLQYLAHTDEPGIATLQLLYNRELLNDLTSSQNGLLIPARDTWGVDIFGNRTKLYTNPPDLVGCQVIGIARYNPILLMGTIGTKNSSYEPYDHINNRILEGNEYLPGSVQIQDKISHEPVASVTNPSNFVIYSLNLVQRCLVLPGNPNDGGKPNYLYGYFSDDDLSDDSFEYGLFFVAAQGKNIADLLTPQAERAFDVPVHSTTVVGILTKINAAEALSNACHDATTPTRWTANVQEWVKSDSGTITLNFFPVSMIPNVYDAWAKTAYSAATYTAPTKTFTINPTTAPSQLIVSNEVYLGCNEVFTNSYGGIVPALTANTLAGVPIDEAFLTQIRTALNGILHKYQTNTACVACGGYDLPTALHTAGISNDAWSTVVGGLILPSHITELQKVLGVLTDELHCCCSNITFTLSPPSADASGTNALPDGSSNVVYSTTITGGGTDCPHYKFTVASGSSLPPDLILTNLTDTSAAIIGTPTTVGSNTFVITVTETNGCSTNQTYSIAINSWSGTALCDCPCWPPNTCPSGSLAQTYIVTAWHQLYKFDPLNWNECKLTAPTVVTASTDWYDHCHWQAGSISELPTAPIACRSTTDGGVTWSDWSTGLTYLDAGIPGCGWIVAMTGTAPYGATKQTGLTPIGSYSRSDVFAEATATVTVSPPSASSAGEGIGPVAPGRALR